MKKLLLSALVMAGTVLGVTAQNTYTLKPEATSLTWTGKKVTGEHTGGITPASGKFEVKKGTLASGEIVINMKSITCTDMEGEYADKLVGHLHSDDFFSTEKFPDAKLNIKKAVPTKSGEGKYNYMITADLTIKGQTHEVTFPAIIDIKDNKLAAAGEIVVDRTKYDIRYGSASFFDDLGDKAISNEFIINFKVGAAS